MHGESEHQPLQEETRTRALPLCMRSATLPNYKHYKHLLVSAQPSLAQPSLLSKLQLVSRFLPNVSPSVSPSPLSSVPCPHECVQCDDRHQLTRHQAAESRAIAPTITTTTQPYLQQHSRQLLATEKLWRRCARCSVQEAHHCLTLARRHKGLYTSSGLVTGAAAAVGWSPPARALSSLPHLMVCLLSTHVCTGHIIHGHICCCFCSTATSLFYGR